MPSKKKPCIDCGKLVSGDSTRCILCFAKARLKPDEQAFWEKVNKNGPTMPHMTTPCWVWIGAKSKLGYGELRFTKPTGRKAAGKAHRFSYKLHNGILPKDKDICHKCDNPSCVNPDHLFAGTARDNILDMKQKGRLYYPKGSKNKRAVVNEQIVKRIRALHEQGISYRQLAIRFGIGATTVSHIIKRETWRHI